MCTGMCVFVCHLLNSDDQTHPAQSANANTHTLADKLAETGLLRLRLQLWCSEAAIHQQPESCSD